jgi:hypothetical protein
MAHDRRLERLSMTTRPTPDAAPQPAPDRAGTRQTRTPLTPARVGESIGADTDPEQDVAPNLGGEEQMQDA